MLSLDLTSLLLFIEDTGDEDANDCGNDGEGKDDEWE